jgi:site-specific DNA recombinase
VRAAVYTRISEDQTGERLGVTRQLDDCLGLADRLGWDVVARFDDNDLSAFNGKSRPGFEAMLEAMKAGEFCGLLCWHTDRLYRSMKDLERLIELADERRVQIRTVNGGDLDLSNSAGRMVARILGSVARQESEHKGERQKRANEQKAAAGKWQTTNRPFGYTLSGEPMESEAALLRDAVADVLAGKSLRKVCTDWNALGVTTTLGNTWNSRQLRATMLNPRYAALRVHRGKIVGPGDWKPLIDADTHYGLVAFLTDPSRRRSIGFERKYLGTGVYRCGRCGGPMKACQPAAGRQRAYVCRDFGHVLRQRETLDEYVETIVLEYLKGTDIHNKLTRHNGVDLGAVQAKRAALQARLDDLAAMFAEGAIDASQLRRGTSELREQLNAVDAVLADYARTSPAANLISAGDAFAEHWEALSPDLKGKIVDELMTVTVLPSPRGTKGFHPEYIEIVWKTV